MKNVLRILIFSFALSSCESNESTNNKTITSINDSISNEKTETRTDTVIKIIEKKVKDNNSVSYIKHNQVIKENQELKLTIDSLTHKISILNNQLSSSKAKKTYNKDITNLVYDLTHAWNELPETRSTKTITKFFLPKYRCNRISIDNDNTAQMSWHTEKDFTKYINAIIKKKSWRYKSSDIEILNVIVKDNKYFSIVYKYDLDTYKKDEKIDFSSFVIDITGKIVNGEYKIANYTWVRFSYM